MSEGDQILALNAGSSNLKLGLFQAATEEQLAESQIPWDLDAASDQEGALRSLLQDVDLTRIAAVGHRVVHGGSRFTRPVLIDTAVRDEIASLATLAPLHNRPALDAIEAVSALLPGIPQVAVFDTSFHATLAPEAYLYAVPYAWYERWGVRRFGFHGLSHAYCAERAAAMLGRPLADLRLVTCHLGSGCSLAAIDGGKSIATTMGFTPLDGLVMATRPGSLDPGLLTYLLDQNRLTLSELEDNLHNASGLKGVSGISGDMREVLAARAAGHSRAALAFDLYIARLRESIGAMTAALGGIDALVFTGGVGEHQSIVRAEACVRLDWLGLTLDESANAASPDAVISTPDSRVTVLVIHTREELMVARETLRVVRGRSGTTPDRGVQ